MSVFDQLPAQFPFDPDLTERPIRFELRAPTSELVVVGILSVFWLIFTGFLAYLGGVWLAQWASLTAISPESLGTLCAATTVLTLARFWFWGAVDDRFRRTSVTIGGLNVEVAIRGLTGTRHWSAPLAEYRGLQLRNLGTHEVGKRKIPIGSVVLVHPDEARSIPISVREAIHVGRKTLDKKAKELGIAVAPEAETLASEPNALLINRFQALKVRILLWAICLVAVFFLAGSLIQSIRSSLDPAWAILGGIFVAAAVAMHFYAARYVVALYRDRDFLRLQTAALIRSSHRIDFEKIEPLTHHEGRSLLAVPSVHAPWIKMRVEGYTAPFVIDLQAEYINRELLRSVLTQTRE